MNTTPQIYLSHTDADGVLPFFQQLADKDGLDFLIKSAAIFKRQVTQLHIRSPKPGDPPVEIACIADRKISREEAERISQAAINYLMDSSRIVKK